MEGKKIDDSSLDQVVGGVIKDGDSSLSISDGNITLVKGDEKKVLSVADFKSSLLEAGFSETSVDKLISMTGSETDYTFAQVKEATGIDISNT